MLLKFFRKYAKRQFFKWFGKFLYFIGLTALIPFLPVVLSSPFSFNNLLEASVIISIILFSIGGFFVYLGVSSVKKTFRTLGFATMFPAAVAFLFFLFGKKIILSLVSPSDVLEDLIIPWVETYVPSVLTVAVIYVVIGLVLIFSSFFFRD
jgi:hypothetical protein